LDFANLPTYTIESLLNMKYFIISLLCTSLSLSAFASESVELKTEQDKINYAVGLQIGGDFKQHNVPLNDKALLKGVIDAISGDKPQLSEDEMQQVLIDFKQKIDAHAHHSKPITTTPQAEVAEGRAFLAKNAKKPGVTVLSSGLQYKILNTGTGKTDSPKDGATVTIRYKGSKVNGRVFGSSLKVGKDTAETYPLSKLVPGVQEGLKKMRAGDRWELFIPAELSFPRGSGPLEFRPIIFEVELVDFK
jgi:FKBP-type peptidyl-prolyl cis-trans isomerase FklB